MAENGIKRLIVIGGSAGGVEALMRLVAGLPGDLPASICVVVHTSTRAKSLLPKLLARAGKLPAKYAESGETLLPSQIYVAPPNFHLIVDGDKMRLEQGPRVNLCRPAVDPLFRTAAATFDGALVGVILSGMLDDGTNGLHAVKAAGGMAIVQNPEETSFSGMPYNAIQHVAVDYILSIDDIAPRLIELCYDTNSKPVNRVDNPRPGHAVDAYSCPECGGMLREDNNVGEVLHFSCHVGHALSVESLMSGQSRNVERVLWSAVRALRERADIAHKLAERLRSRKQDSNVAQSYEQQSQKALKEADEIIAIIQQRVELDDTGHPIAK